MPAPAPAPAIAAAPAPQPGSETVDEAVAAQATSLGIDSPALVAVPGNALSFVNARPNVDFAPVRPALTALLDRRIGEAAPLPMADLTLTSFTGMTRLSGGSAEEFGGALRSQAFVEEMDRVREEVRKEFDLDKTVTVSVAGVSLGMSVVYVLWLIRGGVLMGSDLSALPAWRILDPLPVLSRVDEDTADEDDALDAMAQQPGDPLRGF